MSSIITAGDATNGVSLTAGSNGTLILQSGLAGAKVNALVLAATGALSLAGQAVGTTVGAAGAASALPANPLGYLTLVVNGTTVRLPYYN